jgi:hypothetical protein
LQMIPMTFAGRTLDQSATGRDAERQPGVTSL